MDTEPVKKWGRENTHKHFENKITFEAVTPFDSKLRFPVLLAQPAANTAKFSALTCHKR